MNKKNQILREKWAKSQTKAQKSSKDDILSRRFSDLHRKVGDRCRIWESCHICTVGQSLF